MEQKMCKDCEHFYQHYVYDQNQYHSANCGHCVYPALKDRRPETKACVHFKEVLVREVPPKKKEQGPVQVIINCSVCTLNDGVQRKGNLVINDHTPEKR